ncbi:hypothetical protein [Desulforhopalus singaporensis]|uniref:Uncharacterized protein n=1 Tax=Desulforhopalus singaporensis TaxID=91360 RepID=A0A1H0UUR0_9BACT|nr:hypothetical protein [Desulforhopalus singaporensis]SDP69831.1 hypothetical protein SAMN05660330_03727 [Desulforhopalus singaporensis]
MSNSSLPIPYGSTAQDISAGRFIRLEQVGVKTTATRGEVAELVDELFSIDPCVEPEESAEIQAPEEEEFTETVQKKFDLSLCDQDDGGNWLCQVKVWLSTPGDQFQLRLDNGEELQQAIVGEQVNRGITVKDAASFQLEQPVICNSSFAWLGSVVSQDGVESGPAIERDGNTLYWGKPVTGVIAASYQTEYTMVDLLIYGDDDQQPVDCRVLGFYRGIVEDIDLEVPDKKDDDQLAREKFCGPRREALIDVVDVTRPPWITDRVEYKCRCSGKHHHYEYANEPTPADVGAGEYRFPGITRNVFGDYVDCNEETAGSLAEPEYYQSVCCDPPDIALPKCKKVYVKNTGGKDLDPVAKQEYIERYGADVVQFVPVSPPDGDCGFIVYQQKVDYKSCCDEVVELEWNYDRSAEVLPNDGYAAVYVIGGRAPYTFKTTAQGTFFGNGKKTITSISSQIRIYSDTSFCGSTEVSVTDGCTTATEFLRSDVGQWVDLGYDQCMLPGHEVGIDWSNFSPTADCSSIPGGDAEVTKTKGRYKQNERVVPYCVGGFSATLYSDWLWAIETTDHETRCSNLEYVRQDIHPDPTDYTPCMDWNTITYVGRPSFSVCSENLGYRVGVYVYAYGGHKINGEHLLSATRQAWVWQC